MTAEQMLDKNGVVASAMGCFVVVRLVEARKGSKTIKVVQEVGMGTSRDLKNIMSKSR